MSQANDRTHLLVPRDEAEAILLERVWRAADIKADEVETNQELEHAREREKRWHDYNYDLLTRLFSKNEYADQYRSARIAQRSVEDRYFTPTTSNLAERLVRSIKSQISALRSIIERLNLIDEGPAPASSIENEVQNERNLELLIETIPSCRIADKDQTRSSTDAGREGRVRCSRPAARSIENLLR